MSEVKKMLEKSQVVVTAGPNSFESRNVAKMALGALVLSTALFTSNVTAGNQAPSAPQGYTTEAQQNVNRIPATVVSVKKVRSDGSYENREEERTHRTIKNQMGRIVGGIVGGVLGNKLGGDSSTSRGLGTIAGTLTGAKLADMLRERREENKRRGVTEGNVTLVDERVLVTVDVNLNGSYQRYDIEQSAAVPVKKGDNIFLEPDNKGGVRIIPEEQSPRRKFGR